MCLFYSRLCYPCTCLFYSRQCYPWTCLFYGSLCCLDVSVMQLSVLPLDVSVLQQPVLAMNVFVIQQYLLPLEMSILEQHMLAWMCLLFSNMFFPWSTAASPGSGRVCYTSNRGCPWTRPLDNSLHLYPRRCPAYSSLCCARTRLCLQEAVLHLFVFCCADPRGYLSTRSYAASVHVLLCFCVCHHVSMLHLCFCGAPGFVCLQ